MYEPTFLLIAAMVSGLCFRPRSSLFATHMEQLADYLDGLESWTANLLQKKLDMESDVERDMENGYLD